MNVLAIDVGGTHFKFRTQRSDRVVKVESGPKATPEVLMEAIRTKASGWKYDHVSLGLPGPVVHNKPLVEPGNLGKGWRHFRWEKAFDGLPLRIINDAAMQALGSYSGGRMLFLGLGTGFGAAMVVDGIVQSMEIAHAQWKRAKTYEDFLGRSALKKLGHREWNKQVHKAIRTLTDALECDYVVLGGGNAKLVSDLPANVRLGSNRNAFLGGFLLWKDAHRHETR